MEANLDVTALGNFTLGPEGLGEAAARGHLFILEEVLRDAKGNLWTPALTAENAAARRAFISVYEPIVDHAAGLKQSRPDFERTIAHVRNPRHPAASTHTAPQFAAGRRVTGFDGPFRGGAL